MKVTYMNHNGIAMNQLALVSPLRAVVERSIAPSFASHEWLDIAHLLQLAASDIANTRAHSPTIGPELKSRMLRYERVAAGFAARIQRSMV